MIRKKAKPGYVEIIHPSFTGDKKRYIPKAIFERIQPLLQVSDKELNRLDKFMAFAHDVTNVFKGTTLAIFPKYHFNNFVGNMFQNFVAGVKSKWYPLTRKIQQGKRIVLVDKFGKAHSIDLKYLKRMGITGGQYSAKNIELLLNMDTANWARKVLNNPAIVKGFEIGSTMEDYQRIANFLHFLRESGDSKHAVKMVEKYLYNYSPHSFTKFEKRYMRLIYPFYFFMKRNMSTSARILLSHPFGVRSFKTYYHIKRHAEMGQEDVSDAMMDDNLTRTFKIKVGTDKATGIEKYMPTGGLFPFLQIGELFNALSSPEGLKSFLMRSTNPAIKEIAAQFANYDFEKGEVLDYNQAEGLNDRAFFKFTKWITGYSHDINDSPEMTTYLGINMPKKTRHILKNIRLLQTLNKMNPFDIFGTEKGTSIFGAVSTAKEKKSWKKVLDLFVTTDFEYNLKKGYNKQKNILRRKTTILTKTLRYKHQQKSQTKNTKRKRAIEAEITKLKTKIQKYGEDKNELAKEFHDIMSRSHGAKRKEFSDIVYQPKNTKIAKELKQYAKDISPGMNISLKYFKEAKHPSKTLALVKVHKPGDAKKVYYEVVDVIDGDTFRVKSKVGKSTTTLKVRLDGLDTAETYTDDSPKYEKDRKYTKEYKSDEYNPFGKHNISDEEYNEIAQKAKDFLTKELPPGTEVKIIETKKDKYDRTVAVIYKGDEKISINEKILESGLAKSKYLDTIKDKSLRAKLVCAVNKAKKLKKGIWDKVKFEIRLTE